MAPRKPKKTIASPFSYLTSKGHTGTPFPKRMQIRFRYIDNIAYSSAIYGEYVFRLNSLYDFDYTGTGH
jgi:hypothetical protein